MVESRWNLYDRKSALPSPVEWEKIRQGAKQRAGGRCEYRFPGGGRCREPGTDCNHRGAPDDHDDVEWLCRRHHDIDTQRRSAEARRVMHAKSVHPVERHPGLR